MKVAVLFTGFLRQKEFTKASYYQRLIERFNADVFVSTWDIADLSRPELGSSIEERAGSEVIGSDVSSFFGDRLKDFLIAPYELFRSTTPPITARDRQYDLLKLNGRAGLHGTVWMDRLYSQWYAVRRGLQMIREFEARTGASYDIIARARTDMRFTSEFPEPNPSALMYPSSYPDGRPVPVGAVADHFYWGGREVMFKLETLCFEIEKLYERQNVDTTYAEALFHAFAVKHDLLLQPFDAVYERVQISLREKSGGAPMLVADIIRAANRIEKLSQQERISILEQAEEALRTISEEADVKTEFGVDAALVAVGGTASALWFHQASDNRIRNSLLAAASTLRQSHISRTRALFVDLPHGS